MPPAVGPGPGSSLKSKTQTGFPVWLAETQALEPSHALRMHVPRKLEWGWKSNSSASCECRCPDGGWATTAHLHNICSFVCFCFGGLCLWFHFQEILANSITKQLIPYSFPASSCVVSASQLSLWPVLRGGGLCVMCEIRVQFHSTF